jgi:hypothetical protein
VRYVWLHEGESWLLVNLELVRLGFADASSYPPDVAYQDLFRSVEANARDAGILRRTGFLRGWPEPGEHAEGLPLCAIIDAQGRRNAEAVVSAPPTAI